MIPYNKTKIVATIGPASSSGNVATTYESRSRCVPVESLAWRLCRAQKVIDDIRSISEELKVNTSILVDLQGPKLRIGEVENNEMLLEVGQELHFHNTWMRWERRPAVHELSAISTGCCNWWCGVDWWWKNSASCDQYQSAGWSTCNRGKSRQIVFTQRSKSSTNKISFQVSQQKTSKTWVSRLNKT